MTQTQATKRPWKFVTYKTRGTEAFDANDHYVGQNGIESGMVLLTNKSDLEAFENGDIFPFDTFEEVTTVAEGDNIADLFKAVNCHDELVETGKAFLAYFTNDGGNKSPEYLKTVRLNFKQALSKAEAK